MIVARPSSLFAFQHGLLAHWPNRVLTGLSRKARGSKIEMAAKKKRQLCVYCHSPKDLTRDHIPPKSFFPKPRPTNLITVLCCRECHEEFTENDEYLRNYLVLSPQCRGHVAARQLQKSGLRSLQDPNAGQFSNPYPNIANRRRPSFLASTIASGYGASVASDDERIEDVIERIVVGLFWVETDKYLPPGYSVDVVGSYDFRYMDWQVQQSVRRLQSEEEPANIGEGVFQYWWSRAENAPPEETHRSDWMLQFYEGTTFLCRVARSQESVNPSPQRLFAVPSYSFS